MNTLRLLLTCLATSGLDGFRGGRFIADEQLPGRNQYYAAPLVGLVAWLNGFSPLVSICWALAWWHWAVYAWGHLFGLGRFRPTDRPPSLVEAWCLRLAGHNPHGAFFLRHLLVVPGLLLVAAGIAFPWPWAGFEALAGALAHAPWWIAALGLPFAAGRLVAYEAMWQVADRRPGFNPIMWAELLAGVLWGLLIGGLAWWWGLPFPLAAWAF